MRDHSGSIIARIILVIDDAVACHPRYFSSRARISCVREHPGMSGVMSANGDTVRRALKGPAVVQPPR
jgi:hypothetical protein